MPLLRTRHSAVWFALVLQLGACSHDYQLMKAEEQFNAYGAAIRWNLFKRAVDYLATPPDPPLDWQLLKNVKVTGYRVEFRDLYPSGKVATQTVEIRYLPPDSVVELRLIDEQRWRFDDQRDRWLLESGLPRFKTTSTPHSSQPLSVPHSVTGE